MHFAEKRRICNSPAYFIAAKRPKLSPGLYYCRKRKLEVGAENEYATERRQIKASSVDSNLTEKAKLKHDPKCTLSGLDLRFFSNFIPLHKEVCTDQYKVEFGCTRISSCNNNKATVTCEDEWFDNKFWKRDYVTYEDLCESSVEMGETEEANSYNCYQYWNRSVKAMDFEASSS